MAIRGIVIGGAWLVACGASQPQDPSALFARVRASMQAEVATLAVSEEHSRAVEELVASEALLGMSRGEVETSIGRGDECSRHPRCEENEFDDGDWFYDVGAFGGTQVPLLIVGFDGHGRVDRTWNLRTH